jgi:hypothetical protein
MPLEAMQARPDTGQELPEVEVAPQLSFEQCHQFDGCGVPDRVTPDVTVR